MKKIQNLQHTGKLFIVCLAVLFAGTTMAQNLASGWDGNGITGAGSEPDKFGWDCTKINADGWTQAGSGAVRYMDNQSYLPGERLMFVRWDGSGGTNASSIYSYPVQLTAYKSYQFSIKYTHHSNTKTDFVIGVNAAKDNSGESLAAGVFTPAAQSFREASFRIVPAESKTYYITVGASASQMLGAITALSVTEIPPVLETEKASLRIDYFTPEQATRIYSNGSDDLITFTAPAGIEITPSSLPSTGGTITVSSPGMVNTSGSITVTQGTDNVQIAIVSDHPDDFFPTAGIDTLTVDGAWCWFADPRAIYHKGTKEQTYFSWVTKEGHIDVASYNHETKEYKQYRIWERFQEDDHANPSLLIRNDGRIIIFIAAHFGDKIHRFITTDPEDITSWGEKYSFSNTVTYPYPFQVGDSICVFYRGGSDWHPRLSVSTDNGATFDDGRLLIEGGGQRPYTRYCQGPDGSIHIAVTTGHPRNEPQNKIHYCRFKDNKVYKADGMLIKDVTTESVNLNQLEVVYNGTTYGKGWIWDITLEPETGHPVMVYASFPTDTDHRYHYARWDGTTWFNKQITEAGRWFPQTPEGAGEPEPNYSGGIILDYDDPSTVYLSKEVKGTFEIFKYTTTDKGQNWNVKALTWNTPSHLLNVRPIVPRHHKEGLFDVVWMRGTYVYYGSQKYNTALVFPETQKEDILSGIELDKEEVRLLPGESVQLMVNYTPFFTTQKGITWTSSNELVVRIVDGKVTAIAPGYATITATGYNGIEANCRVSVDELLLFFDFGTPTSPLAEGATRVSESTLWSTGSSYGWVGIINSRDRGDSWNSEERDFNMYGTPVVFRAKVSNGSYGIILKQGDASYAHDKMTVKVNSEIKLNEVTSNTGQVLTSNFDVTTNSGQLDFEFSRHGVDLNWVVNSLKIIKRTASSTTERDEAAMEELQSPETKISIFDVSGRFIFRDKLGSRTLSGLLAEKNLSSGIYLIRMELGEKQKTVKYMF